jgi:hypothetical protein
MKPKSNPLKRGFSRKTIRLNIRRMIREGYPRRQAIAASLSTARREWKARHRGALPVWLRRNPTYAGRLRKAEGKRYLIERRQRGQWHIAGIYRSIENALKDFNTLKRGNAALRLREV